MNKIRIASRMVLISTDVFGIFSICELLKPVLENRTAYLIVFVILVVMSFGSIIDWNTQASKKK